MTVVAIAESTESEANNIIAMPCDLFFNAMSYM